MKPAPLPKITITFYHSWQNQTARRSFPLRNLHGDTTGQHIAHADRLLEQIVEELRYISGHGLLKADIQIDSTVHVEHILSERFPPPDAVETLSFVLTVRFHQTTLIPRKDGTTNTIQGTKTINVPCVSHSPLRQRGTKDAKRGDPVFERFCNRFARQGHLSLDSRYESWGIFGRARFKTLATIKQIGKRKKTAQTPAAKPSRARRADYIYLIHSHDDLFKIGKSKDPEKRLAALQTSSPYKLTLVHHFQADKANRAESILHALLSGSRRVGEWFALTAIQRELISKIDEYKENAFWAGGEKLDLEEL